ncbi:MAG: hypothetical protein H6Q14_2766 [Bacteroidetes bacterium]|nr:hypothetical protein [Bacteroidota bacterium]
MRNFKILELFLSIILTLIVMGGCRKYAEFGDVAFFTGTESSALTKFTIEEPSNMGITVKATEKVPNDVIINLKIDAGLLKALNQSTGKSYAMPPEGSYSLSADNITIKAGSYISDAVSFEITSFDNFKDGVNYCVPVTITSVEGGLSVLESSRTIYIVVNRVVITKAVNLKKSVYFTVPTFQTSADVSAMSEVTMECRVYVNNFQSYTPYISSIMGIEENFLLRFGDVSCDKNQMQIAGGKVSGTRYPVTGDTRFATGRWYHVAVVYDGSTMALYVDGKLDKYTSTEKGIVNFNDTYSGGFHIGFSETGRLLDGYVSEARVWSKALTQNELQDNLCYVDPASENLVAYWRFNDVDEEGNIPDLSGHGHLAEPSSKSLTWVEAVKCANN